VTWEEANLLPLDGGEKFLLSEVFDLALDVTV
jgi:hypothetical protein